MMGHFVFAICNQGSEKALKENLQGLAPSLHSAYSRPGFLTFKNSSQTLPWDYRLPSPLAQHDGLVIAKGSAEDILAATASLPASFLQQLQQNIYLATWQRCSFTEQFQENFLKVRESLLSSLALDTLTPYSWMNTTFQKGDGVLTLMQIQEEEYFLGATLLGSSQPRIIIPLSETPFVLPAEAPSRSYLKMKEALHWTKAPLTPGDWAVEIGSSPGGASLALLQAGLSVVGIDSAPMDKIFEPFEKQKRFLHLPRAVQTVILQDLPHSPQWIVMDVNVEPQLALRDVTRLAREAQTSLLGALLTLKMKNWSLLSQLPQFAQQLQKVGLIPQWTLQLPSNRREIFLYALTLKGQNQN